MKTTLDYLSYLAMTMILLATPADLLAAKKSSSHGKIHSVYDEDFDYELYVRVPDSVKEQWFIDTGNSKGDPEERYIGPFTLKEAQNRVMLLGDIPLVSDGPPFGNHLRPNIVMWVYVMTFDTFAELGEMTQIAKDFGLHTTYRVVPENPRRRN